MFRHEKTFVNKTLFAVQFSDAMDDDELARRMENIKKVDYERIGEQMHVEIVAVKYTGNRSRYLDIIKRLKELQKIFVLVCDDVDAATEAAALVKETKPVLVGANNDNLEEMVKLAKESGIVLGLNAPGVEEMYALVEKHINWAIKN